MVVALLLLLSQAYQPRFVEETTLTQNSDSLISQSWTMEDGLPVNTVNSVVQDHHGYIWFTTYDGIVRFDGIEFKNYNHTTTEEIPQNRAVFMHRQDSVGIWVTLENGGVLLIDQEDDQFTHFDEADGFTSSNTTHLMEDRQGRMWFSTFDGLYRYDGDTFTRQVDRETSRQNRISYAYEDTDGSIWVSTHDGLVHLKNGEQQVYRVHPESSNNEFFKVERLSSGELMIGSLGGIHTIKNEELKLFDGLETFEDVNVLYLYDDAQRTLISTDRGLFRYKDEKLTQLTVNDVTDVVHFWKITKDSQGKVWLISTKGVIYLYQDGELVNMKQAGVMDQMYVNNFFEDRESNIWIASARSGIYRFKPSKVKTLAREEGLSGNNILGLFEDSQGRFWVGTRDYGLNVIDGDQVTQYREAGISSRDIVHTINEDPAGNVWVGYYQGGLDRFNGEDIQSYDLGFGAGVNDVRTVFVSSDSTIWVGTYGGLVKLDPYEEQHTYYTKEDGLSSNLIRYIDEGKDGSLWIATMSGGVNHFKDGTFTHYTTEDGLASNNIRSVYVDREAPETIWVGTENNGLSRIRPEGIVSLSTNEGLPNHVIHYIKEDANGWLWMSSNNGIFKVDKQGLNKYLDGSSDFFNMVHFGAEEGMRNPEANGSFQQGGLLTSYDTFWFATQEGVAIFETEPKRANEVAPTVLIDRVVTSSGDIFEPDSIDFEPGTEAFRIDYKALTFVSPEKTRFRYMLEGFEEEWNEVNNERSVLYAEVPPGDYTFRVLAANNDGVWSEAGASVSFSIEPVFYKQVWFYLLVVGLIIVGYYGVSRVRYHYLVRQQERLKSIIEEQTAQLRKEKNEIEEQSRIIKKQAAELEESNQTKDRFFSLIAHDLRNPFQAIMGYSEFLLQTMPDADKEDIESGLEHIHTSSKSLLELVEHLLNWASLNTGRIKPNPEPVNLKELIQRSHQLFEHVAQHKKIELLYKVEDDTIILADLNMLETILRNLISNAIKFTNEGGQVIVALETTDQHHVIKIEDTGIGMSDEMVDKLLRLDANISRSGTNNEKGSGLGLLICKEMVELHEGELAIESEEGVGTIFKIYLPTEGIAEPITQAAEMESE